MKILLTLLIVLQFIPVFGEIKLPGLVGDGMVIQRNTRVKIWGWADKGATISIRFKNRNYSSRTGTDGRWEVWLRPAEPGGPFTMHLSGNGSTLTINDIMIGDVWLCAGQSNMVHNLELHQDRYRKEIEEAVYPHIRQFLVPSQAELNTPSEDMKGHWRAATPDNVKQFSVVGYFFALQLHKKYNIPIGIINASVGGTPIEAWMSEKALSALDAQEIIRRNKDSLYVADQLRRTLDIQNHFEKSRSGDAGLSENPKWYHPDYQPENWSTINIPGYWEDQGVKDLNGVVWYRREIEIPPGTKGPARLIMGRIVDADEVYLNGTRIGNKTYQYPQRRYPIPEGLLKPGKNTLVIRVTNYTGKGGFVPDKPYHIETANDLLDLKGTWYYKTGEVFDPSVKTGGGFQKQNQPTSLYNGMIHPLKSFAIKGVAWYQGESNANQPKKYERLLPALIRDWREHWNQPALPFLYVQLPNFMDVPHWPGESDWAALREAQRKTLRVPNTAMVVAIDLGEWNDIHPGNKKPIGERLALAAQRVAYGENTVFSGPLYDTAFRQGNKIIIRFNPASSGLHSIDGQALKWFALAGADKQFVWATAHIEGDHVAVWNDKIQTPVYVRYAWADNPAGVNFYNRAGLPASPFEAQISSPLSLWHGKNAAVVLTYDDALAVHLDHALPMLDSVSFKATFYLSGSFPGCKDRIVDWKKAARNGHELGNHSWYHPCDGSKPGRSWVSEQNDLSRYSTSQLVKEIEMTNIFLEALDGQKIRTFAYTCGDTATGEGSFIETISNHFLAMRGVHGDLNKPGSLALRNLNCYVVDEQNADQLIPWAERAKQENALLVVLIHGVGGGHGINVPLEKHNAFLRYLKKHENEYWVTTLREAVQHTMELQNKRK